MKSKHKILLAALASVGITFGSTLPANAFSDSRHVFLPGTSIQLQANAWSPNIISGERVDFVTSSKATQNGSAKSISSIKNTATIEARGINASISLPAGVGASGSSASKSLSWTNNNSWISDLSGTASYSGLTISVHVNSAAFVIHAGVKSYVDVWSW